MLQIEIDGWHRLIFIVLFFLVLMVSGCNRGRPAGGSEDGETIEGLVCGNGICESGEDAQSCSNDCCSALYDRHERICLEHGWQKIVVDVEGLPRQLLWKGPEQSWEKGTIITLHGGGGTHSNYCSGPSIGEPMEKFSELAIEEGFAIFSLDSSYGLVTDREGRSCGKRWDSLYQEHRSNIDLLFIGTVLTKTIPEIRPPNSSEDIFVTGISNGGFMTILAAIAFGDEVTAFAPVSAGDPFGTYFDMGTKTVLERRCAPGVFRDSETHELINQINACSGASITAENELLRRNLEEKPAFKQFHHQGDGACNISCVEKARMTLVEYGYEDDGAFIIENNGRSTVWKHFWMEEYNQPIIDFFTEYGYEGK
ncbi:MAG: hypothetical protein GTO18_16480 [Anaerolineales bacterium]|nr:hypothetical protein [Anaerolineales bacterium]